ncbi:MAG TPA: alpha/beta hydrolase-fold protein [Candidatus Acidoferrales bacterium]|jgi:S-formylglutathione hydrolase FrmB|nr:alpha/beta hydrolase-fold protein [Candidatus Acidoferrales bacterium]
MSTEPLGRGTPTVWNFGLACALVYAAVNSTSAFGATAIVLDRTHESQVFHETRHYRIFLPPDYETSGKRYPVVYFFHGWGERYNQCSAGHDYDQGTDYGGDNFASFVGTHDLIVVRWDGYNPRTPAENYVRPYNIGPVETDRQFPLYFPELVRYIDATYRTIPDREHRGTSGLSMGGFMSSWVAGKYPDLVSSMSNFMGSSEFVVGPRGFPVEYRHEEMHNNYDGMRARMIMGTDDFIQFYHRRMNLIWNYTQPHHESEVFKADHGTPGIAKTMMFHMHAFANPLPRPAVWNHSDVYPEFSAWGWEVTTDRKEHGFTVLENVSPAGFRSCVREWLPSGRVLAGVPVRITTPSSYRSGQEVTVNLIRLRDSQVRHLREKADSKGRLTVGLDGEEYEVGIGSGTNLTGPNLTVPNLALAGFAIEGAAWATDTEPVNVRVRFVNKGGHATVAMRLRWETPNAGVRLDTATATIPPLPPGKSAAVPLAFTVQDPTREIVKLFAVGEGVRLPLEIPTFPPARKTGDFRIADGLSLPVYRQGETVEQSTLGTGNGDGQANAGERIAILLPEGNAYRAAELFTNDPCVDLTRRASDNWGGYDHVGASAKIGLPLVRASCPSGHLVRALARVQLPDKPNHTIRYAVVEFEVK